MMECDKTTPVVPMIHELQTTGTRVLATWPDVETEKRHVFDFQPSMYCVH